MPRIPRSPADMPASLAVFPLGGAILFPRAVLPLNIFEPRYLAMFDHALAGDRMIGIIQPAAFDAEGDATTLCGVGCAGRLTSWQHLDDGRYLVSLTGVSRFRATRESETGEPWRAVIPDWSLYASDFSDTQTISDSQRDALGKAFSAFLTRRNLNADWSSLANAPPESLVNTLAAGCPFNYSEKQALLEAPTLSDRCDALVSLLIMEAGMPPGGEGYLQ